SFMINPYGTIKERKINSLTGSARPRTCFPYILYRMKKTEEKRAKKRRLEVLLPVDLMARIDAVAGRRGRRRFVEEAVRAELRRRALEAWFSASEKFQGLSLEDTLYAGRKVLEERGR
ncbi:MAG: hypothetical protein QXO00_07045, partial [Candidatus Bathyarchaeia archaeon]